MRVAGPAQKILEGGRLCARWVIACFGQVVAPRSLPFFNFNKGQFRPPHYVGRQGVRPTFYNGSSDSLDGVGWPIHHQSTPIHPQSTPNQPPQSTLAVAAVTRHTHPYMHSDPPPTHSHPILPSGVCTVRAAFFLAPGGALDSRKGAAFLLRGPWGPAEGKACSSWSLGRRRRK